MLFTQVASHMYVCTGYVCMYVCMYNKQGKATSTNVGVSLDRLQMKNGLKVR